VSPRRGIRVTTWSYDVVPYTSYPYARTHPDRLETVGRLFGMDPAPAGACRVLELGCASGGNLVPMAEQLPGSEFVGVDLGARQIEEGLASVRALGLRNVELRHADIVEVDERWGSFDYVICHGVYSWVEPRVQRKILQILAERLSPQGIGLVSYNTYPGWHLREAVRHMMRWHTAAFSGPAQRAAQGGALVEFLAEAVDPAGAYGQLLRRELEILQRTGADYLLHEHLEEVNSPCYFHQMIERAHAEGLQYLGDADVPTMLTRGLDPAVAQTLARISPDIIRLEQYLDFVHNRQFRHTLLCHAQVELQRSLGPAQLHGGWVRCTVEVEGGTVDLSPGVRVAMRGAGGLAIESDLPLTKAGLVVLRRVWPDVVRFEALVEQAVALLHEAGVEVPAELDASAALGSDLLELYCRGGLELHRSRPQLCTTVSERPRASAHARHWAERRGFVVSQWHVRVDVDSPAAAIVRRLDGEHDRAALLEALQEDVRAGGLRVSEGADALAVAPDRLQRALSELLERTLFALALHGVLVG
jgi:SAM-dependent methyltransferase